MAANGVLRIKIVGDDGPLGKTLKGAGGKLSSFAGAAAKVGAAAAAGVGVLAVKSFADFDEQMNKSLAIMGDVSEGMRKDMSDAAREVGKTTTFSAAEAAESYFFLASAGLDAEQQIAALPQVAAFAQAGMFDMATATDLATDAQSALGLASDDAEQNLENLTRVTDVFVKANTLANTSVEQISEAMTNKAGAAMKSVGMEIEEGSAVLAAFADQGTKGAAAGTQFAIVLRDLQTKALDNKDAFEEAGVAVFDADGEMRNMADIVGDLEGHLDGMSDAQTKAALATMGFSDKSMGALQTLLGSSDAIREYEGELREAGGTVKEVADKQLETFNAKMGLLKDRFMDFAIGAGSVIVPKILQAFDAIEAWWSTNGPAIMAAIERFGQIASQVFGTIQQVISRVVSVVQDVMGRFRGELGDSESKVSGWFQKVSAIFVQVREVFSSAFGAIRTIVETAINIITAFWERFGTHILSFLQRTVARLLEVVSGLFEFLKGIFDLIKAVLTGQWGDAWQAILDILSGAWKAISNLVTAAFDAVKTIFGAGVAAISQVWSFLWDQSRDKVRAVWDWITDKISTALNFVKDLFLNFTGPGLLLKHWDDIRDGISEVTDFFREKWDGVLEFFRGIPGKIGSAASGMWDGITRAFKGAINAIIRGWNSLEFRIPGFKIGPVGYDGFTLGVPNIPMLAQGGVFAANSPTLAVVGDNKTQREIVSPVNAMKDAMRDVLRERGGGDVIQNFYGPVTEQISGRNAALALRMTA